MATAKAQELGQGDTILYAGFIWTILDQLESGCLALSNTCVTELPFSDDIDQNWINSRSRKKLNEDFLQELIAKGALETDLNDLEIDLTAINGDAKYGTDQCKVGLLTKTQADAYKKDDMEYDIIPLISDWYWLSTAYSHNEYYAEAAYTHNVQLVRPEGTQQGALPDSALYGVRPVILLKPSATVSYTPGLIDKEIGELAALDIVDPEQKVTFTPEATKYIHALAAKCKVIPKVIASKDAASAYAGGMTADAIYLEIRNRYNSEQSSITGSITLRDLFPVLDSKI